MALGHMADDAETQTGPARLTRAGFVHSVEALEDALLVGEGDAYPIVGDA